MNAVTEIAPAGLGHNSASFVEMVENDPGVVFREAEVLPALIKEIRDEIESAEIDLETDRGRKAIASRAARIARRKTAIDAAGKDLNEEHRKAINAVDAVRREARNTLDGLRDTARAPLDEWEAAEEARKAALAETIARLDSYGRHPDLTLEDIARQETDISEIVITEEEFGGFYTRAVEAKEGAIAALATARTRIEKAEAEHIELEKLRAAQAARDAEAAKENAIRQRINDLRQYIREVRSGFIGGQPQPFAILIYELDTKILPEIDGLGAAANDLHDLRKDALTYLQDAMERREKEAQAREREEAEREAQRAAQAAIDKAEADRIAAEREIERQKQEFEAQKAREQAARDAEAKRLKDEADAAAAEEARRARNRKLIAEARGAAKEAIIKAGGISDEQAVAIVLAIHKGEVPGVTLKI